MSVTKVGGYKRYVFLRFPKVRGDTSHGTHSVVADMVVLLICWKVESLVTFGFCYIVLNFMYADRLASNVWRHFPWESVEGSSKQVVQLLIFLTGISALSCF